MTIDTILNFLQQFAADFWATMTEMSPYLLFGFLMAGFLSVLIPPSVIERHLGGKGLWPIVKASLFGVPLPLCSCSVIPVSMALHKHGASKASTISFLLSTPHTGAENIFVIYSLLGLSFAIFSPIAAFVSGIVGGILVMLFGEKKFVIEPAPDKCSGECCTHPQQRRYISRALKYGFINMPMDIGGPVLVGTLIAAAISAFIPNEFFAQYLPGGLISMLVMMLIGIPIYVCATASIPIAAALIMKGLSPGAAWVFLMTGPATNAASFMVIWKKLGKRTAVIYLLAVAGSALAFGLLIDYVFKMTSKTQTMEHVHEMPTNWLKTASAIFLFAILIYGIYRKMRRAHTVHADHADKH